MRVRNLLLLWILLSSYNVGFSQRLTDSIIKRYADNPSRIKDSRYRLVEISTSSPWEFINRIYLASTRKFSEYIYIIDRFKFKDGLAVNPYIKRHLLPNDEWKLSPQVSAIKEAGKRDQQKIYLFSCILTDPGFVDILLQKYPVLKSSAKLLPQQKILTLKITYAQVEAILLHDDAVVFIDVQTATPGEELGTPGYDLSANKINLLHKEYPFINGAGQHVSIKEDYYDTTDIDLKGRFEYSPLASRRLSNHANFMATIIAGAGNSIYFAKGAAPAAQVSSSAFEPVLPDADSVYLQNNITVQNHSYGTIIESNYGLSALAFDQSSNNNPGLLHVFSSGNIGADANTAGNYIGIPGYANLTGNFKMAKNILTVGAVDSFGNLAPLSSRGPAYDGRIKPELVAFQQNGTSEAAALVSGTVLLLQQYYHLKNPGSSLPSALAKAALINTADDIDAPGPDFKTGFGNMNAVKAMDLLKDDKIFTGNIKQGAAQTFPVIVPENVSLLKVTLAWNDPAAPPLATRALVNDLDIEVALPSANLSWKPWALNSAANIDSLRSQATRKKDSLNNVEQVTIELPAAGIYNINVKGYNLPAGGQTYHVVYSWDSVDYFKWVFPVSTGFAEGGSRSVLRWQNSFMVNGQVEYAFISSDTWHPVSSNIDLRQNSIYWNVPDTISAAVLRMKVGNKYFYSDTFAITTLLQPATGFICGDSILIYWNKIKNAGRYQLYQLGEKYMEPFLRVSDTIAVIAKNILKDKYLAVAPVLGNATNSLKSYSFDYTTQGAGCYIDAFYVDKNADVAKLILSLGTLINISSISFEKQITDGSYTAIQNPVVTGQLQYIYEYGPLMPGITTFRAKINLNNGQVIYSDPQRVFYAAPGRYVLLPVPVSRNNDINLITAIPDGELISIIDVLGRTVLQQEIRSSRELIKTSRLQRGQYFYTITKKGARLAAGKLIIL